MRILWYNWKDIKHPEAGGADVYTHEIARRLVERGHTVTLFASKFESCKNQETIDGITVIRSGGKYSVYSRGRTFYKENKGKFDLVVDEINTRPFLSPKFVECKIVALIHQLAREFWFYETPLPMAILGYLFLEKIWLRNYRGIPIITVSESTKKDLESLGLTNISIVHNGLNVKPLQSPPTKSDKPTIIYVGRMKKAKKPKDVIDAFQIVKQQIPHAQLWMIGDGYLRSKLESKFRNVKFYGRVSADLRDELVKKAWVIAVPGVREGWGQVVSDSNALGTPAVGYNVPGLRDSIKSGYNGLLVSCNSASLAQGLEQILTDGQSREIYMKNAIEWASQLSWDKSAATFEEILEKV